MRFREEERQMCLHSQRVRTDSFSSLALLPSLIALQGPVSYSAPAVYHVSAGTLCATVMCWAGGPMMGFVLERRGWGGGTSGWQQGDPPRVRFRGKGWSWRPYSKGKGRAMSFFALSRSRQEPHSPRAVTDRENKQEETERQRRPERTTLGPAF